MSGLDKKWIAAGAATLGALAVAYKVLTSGKKPHKKPHARIGGIEGGGTTFVVSYADSSDPTTVIERKQFETESPDVTLATCIKYLKEWQVKAVGIAAFGPTDLEPSSPTYGYITSTPKEKWRNCNILGIIQEGVGHHVPVSMETDVNSPAQSEALHGRHHGGRKINACCYITVGTGVGCGLTIFGKILKGFGHAEAGHIRVKIHPDDEEFKGSCPFHADCVEGLVSAGAIAKRLQMSAKDLAKLPDNHQVWNIVAYYMAQLCVTLTLVASPEVIVIGGGVLKRKILYEKIREQFTTELNGYVKTPPVAEYIVPSRFGDNAGTVGALEIAKRAWEGIH